MACSRPLGGARAFTLIELLVVISIIAVLTSVLMPSVKLVRDSARTVKCKSNLRQILLSVQGYATDWDGRLVSFNNDSGLWFVHLATYLDAKRTKEEDIQADLMTTKSPIWGCPIYNDLNKSEVFGSDGRPGYGMSTKPALPASAEESDWSVADARDFYLLELIHPSQRILAADAMDMRLTANYSGSTPEWSVVSPLLPNDPKRHRGRANYGFVDAHVTTLPPEGSAYGYLDPSKFGEK